MYVRPSICKYCISGIIIPNPPLYVYDVMVLVNVHNFREKRIHTCIYVAYFSDKLVAIKPFHCLLRSFIILSLFNIYEIDVLSLVL